MPVQAPFSTSLRRWPRWPAFAWCAARGVCSPKRLGVCHGETTPDGRYTLRKVECLAACGMGPCMQVGFDYHENLDEAKVDALLEKLK